MAQKNTVKGKTEASIKRMVSDRFLHTIEQTIDSGVVKNKREFATRIQEHQKELSMIQNPDNNRYVDVEMMYKAVNELGVNANYFLVDGGEKTEKLIREGVQINGGAVSGNNNVVLTGQAVSNGGDVFFNVQKVIQNLPEKDKNAILKKINDLETQNNALNAQMADLKKTIARYEREIEKDKKIIDTQDKLIKMMEDTQKGKK